MVYGVLAIGTAMVLFIGSRWLGDGTRSAPARASLSAVGGVLWPVLLLGGVQLGAVALWQHRIHETVERGVGVPL